MISYHLLDSHSEVIEGAGSDKSIDNQPIESIKINNKRKNQAESKSLEDNESKNQAISLCLESSYKLLQMNQLVHWHSI